MRISDWSSDVCSSDLVVPAVVAACALVAAPVQAQFGGLLRKVTTPTPSPESDDNGGCPKGKTGSSVGRGILGSVLRDAVGDAASKAGVSAMSRSPRSAIR